MLLTRESQCVTTQYWKETTDDSHDIASATSSAALRRKLLNYGLSRSVIPATVGLHVGYVK